MMKRGHDVESAPNIWRRRTAMEHYAGIDVSLELSSVCVVDAQGKIVKEAEWLGLDVDCSSKLLHRKLANQATWRGLIGTVFTHGYANLLDCVKSGQLRTAMAGA